MPHPVFPGVSPFMKKLFSLVLFLLFAGLVACSGSTDAESTLPSQKIDQTETGTSVTTGLATSTPEPLPKVFQAPEEITRAKQFSDAADRDLFRLTKELVPGSGDIPRTLPGSTVELRVGIRRFSGWWT